MAEGRAPEVEVSSQQSTSSRGDEDENKEMGHWLNGTSSPVVHLRDQEPEGSVSSEQLLAVPRQSNQKSAGTHSNPHNLPRSTIPSAQMTPMQSSLVGVQFTQHLL